MLTMLVPLLFLVCVVVLAVWLLQPTTVLPRVITFGHWGDDEADLATALSATPISVTTTALQSYVKCARGTISGAFNSASLLSLLPIMTGRKDLKIISTASTLASTALDAEPSIIRLPMSDDRTVPQLQRVLVAALPTGGAIRVYHESGNAWASGMADAVIAAAQAVNNGATRPLFTIEAIADIASVNDTAIDLRQLLCVYSEEVSDVTALTRLSNYTILLGDIHAFSSVPAATENRVLATINSVNEIDSTYARNVLQRDVNPFVASLHTAVTLARNEPRNPIVAELHALGFFHDGVAADGVLELVQLSAPPAAAATSFNSSASSSSSAFFFSDFPPTVLMLVYPPSPCGNCAQTQTGAVSTGNNPASSTISSSTVVATTGGSTVWLPVNQVIANFSGAYNGSHTAAVIFNMQVAAFVAEEGGEYVLRCAFAPESGGDTIATWSVHTGVSTGAGGIDIRLVDPRMDGSSVTALVLLWLVNNSMSVASLSVTQAIDIMNGASITTQA